MLLKFEYKDGHIRLLKPLESFILNVRNEQEMKDKMMALACDTGKPYRVEMLIEDDLITIENQRNAPFKSVEIPKAKYEEWRLKRKKALIPLRRDLENPTFKYIMKGGILYDIAEEKAKRKLQKKAA